MNTTKEELISKALLFWMSMFGSAAKAEGGMHTITYQQFSEKLEKHVNQQVLTALKEVKSKQQNLWTEMASDGNEYRIKAVPLSAIEQIEEKYR